MNSISKPFHPNLGEKDKIYILSSLQEESRNIDAQSMLESKTLPTYVGKKTKQYFNADFNEGNKPIAQTTGERFDQFLKWAFENDSDYIIVAGGHSGWYRSFFRKFMDQKVDHIAKKNKIANCGCVAFKLNAEKGNYQIETDSITVIYQGFDEKKKK